MRPRRGAEPHGHRSGHRIGRLTVALSWFSGTTGKVHTFEAREEFHKLARRNLEWAGVGQNVTMHCQDIAEGFGDVTGADACSLMCGRRGII